MKQIFLITAFLFAAQARANLGSHATFDCKSFDQTHLLKVVEKFSRPGKYALVELTTVADQTVQHMQGFLIKPILKTEDDVTLLNPFSFIVSSEQYDLSNGKTLTMKVSTHAKCPRCADTEIGPEMITTYGAILNLGSDNVINFGCTLQKSQSKGDEN